MLRRLIKEERGQASTELMGMIWWLLLVAFIVWQLLLAAWAVDQAAQAARVASRVGSRGNADKAAHWAVSDALRDGMKVTVEGDTATVSVRVPIIVPGLGDDRLRVQRSATLPS
jgi:hypothetical protein